MITNNVRIVNNSRGFSIEKSLPKIIVAAKATIPIWRLNTVSNFSSSRSMASLTFFRASRMSFLERLGSIGSD